MTDVIPTLDDNEKAVLGRLDWHYGDYCWAFDTIAIDTNLDRDAVRSACRSLAKQGLAYFSRGLMDDDGNPAGSGYGITPNGRRYLAALETSVCGEENE